MLATSKAAAVSTIIDETAMHASTAPAAITASAAAEVGFLEHTETAPILNQFNNQPKVVSLEPTKAQETKAAKESTSSSGAYSATSTINAAPSVSTTAETAVLRGGLFSLSLQDVRYPATSTINAAPSVSTTAESTVLRGGLFALYLQDLRYPDTRKIGAAPSVSSDAPTVVFK